MFLYLCERVLEQSADDIHEHEVGHKVFGRPLDYDTTADNIVRVHVSMLRKRMEQYFAAEGQHEPIVIEIPKGNYAPIFHDRRAGPERLAPSAAQVATTAPNRKIWILAAFAVLFACSTIFLLFRLRGTASHAAPVLAAKPAVRQFWSQIFRSDQRADIVLDDADLAFYQEITGRKIGLSDYFDRSYLRKINDKALMAKLDRDVAGSMVLKRHSNYGTATFLWKLALTADTVQGPVAVHFARDYTFRELNADNVILLGNSRSNPWIEPFEGRLTLRWKYDDSLGTYYPLDTSARPADQEKYRITTPGVEPREGYTTISLLPNLSGTGNVLIISSTGGATMGAAAEFLSDERSVSQLRSLLPQNKNGQLPYFEVLIKINTRSSLPSDASISICRTLHF